MSFSNRNYQRQFLRAPFRKEILISCENKIFKAHALNLSVGGLLARHSETSLKKDRFVAMIKLPFHIPLKSFSLERLQEYSESLVESKVVTLKGEIVRRFEDKNSGDENIACQITEIEDQSKEFIKRYVESFASNLVYLQTLLEELNSDSSKMLFVKELCRILGYAHDKKIALLNKEIAHDYRSLQWF